MRTYYEDQNIRITSAEIQVGRHRYPLAQLTETWRHSSSLAKRRILLALGVILIAVAVRLTTGYLWWFRGLTRMVRGWLTEGPGSIAIGAIGVLTVAGLGIVAVELVLLAVEDIRGHRRYLELWTRIGSRRILLLRTNDSARFEKVCRALIRALGDLEDPHTPAKQ